jgi:hypothetical protein
VQRISRHNLAILRMHRPRNYRAITARHAHRHHDRFSRTRRAVIHRRVRDLHACQLADHRLELEHCLQRSLRDLRLVRRIARQKLATRDDRIDQHRPIVLVNTRAQKARISRSILVRVLTKLVDDLSLAMLAWNRKIALELVLLRNTCKQIVD